MKHQCCVTCGSCGKEGPPADYVPAARQKAIDAGWSVARRASRGKPSDYCPDCAIAARLPRCQGTPSSPCPAVAMYEIDPGHGSTLHGCGRHYGFLLRAVFRANPGREITLRWLRSSIHGGAFETEK